GKKDNGAYYTPHDVTAYMVAQTLIPRIFDDFEQIDTSFRLLQEDPDRYIQPAMLHGWFSEEIAWAAAPKDLEEVWHDDPIHWHILDTAELDPAICLPEETWVEMFHRRERVENLRRLIQN